VRYAHRDFDQLWLDFLELGEYFPVLGTLNELVMALVCKEMGTGKLFERALSSYWAEI